MKINYLEIAKEVERLVLEEHLNYDEAFEKAKKRYLGENDGSSKVD